MLLFCNVAILNNIQQLQYRFNAMCYLLWRPVHCTQESQDFQKSLTSQLTFVYIASQLQLIVCIFRVGVCVCCVCVCARACAFVCVCVAGWMCVCRCTYMCVCICGSGRMLYKDIGVKKNYCYTVTYQSIQLNNRIQLATRVHFSFKSAVSFLVKLQLAILVGQTIKNTMQLQLIYIQNLASYIYIYTKLTQKVTLQ